MSTGVSIVIPPEVTQLLLRLNRAGFSAFAVGGCVRDSLLGLAPSDWDICTAALPEQIAECFADCRTVPTGVKYGTVTVLFRGVGYEITTYRAESDYSDSRHPDAVSFLASPEGDLSRRDFTVNAMAADAAGNVLDLFGGTEDLAAGCIRCVGVPRERFAEDALRILRALRFAARLGFRVEEQTAAAVYAERERLNAVARERLRKELSGLLAGRDAARILAEFSDVLFAVIPELAAEKGFCQYNPHHAHDVWTHTLATLEECEADGLLRLAALLHDVGKPSVFSMDKNAVGHFYGHAVVGAAMTEQILRRLRYDGQTVRRVTQLVRWHDRELPATARAARRLLALLGEEDALRLLRLRRADALGTGRANRAETEAAIAAAEALLRREAASCFDLHRLELDGKDLMALGVPQGRQVGVLLRRILQAVIDGDVQNERSRLVQYAQNCIREDKMN